VLGSGIRERKTYNNFDIWAILSLDGPLKHNTTEVSSMGDVQQKELKEMLKIFYHKGYEENMTVHQIIEQIQPFLQKIILKKKEPSKISVTINEPGEMNNGT